MTADEIIQILRDKFGDAVAESETEVVEPCVTVDAARITEVCSFLKTDSALDFNSLMCLSGIDHDEENVRVDYHLYSIAKNHKFKLKVIVPKKKPNVPTVSTVWQTANWHEREAFDLIGVVFKGHSDFRRILLPDDWVGHPLRKDYVTPESYLGMPVIDPDAVSGEEK